MSSVARLSVREVHPLSENRQPSQERQFRQMQVVTEMSLILYALTKYTCFDDALIRYFMDIEMNILTYKDFAISLASYLSRDEPGMSVYNSSSWAICYEYYGTLSGDDLEYARGRSGCGLFNASLREIFEDLRETYPVI